LLFIEEIIESDQGLRFIYINLAASPCLPRLFFDKIPFGVISRAGDAGSTRHATSASRRRAVIGQRAIINRKRAGDRRGSGILVEVSD
jgi:hypothetical protein